MNYINKRHQGCQITRVQIGTNKATNTNNKDPTPIHEVHHYQD